MAIPHLLCRVTPRSALTVAVPSGLAGASVWLQIYDPGTLTIGQSIATQVQ